VIDEGIVFFMSGSLGGWIHNSPIPITKKPSLNDCILRAKLAKGMGHIFSTLSLFLMVVLLFLGSICRNKALLRVVFFAWSATLWKILTMDNLRKSHIIVVD
jgi:hypothetical protein